MSGCLLRARLRGLAEEIGADGATQRFLPLVRGEALGLFVPRTRTDEAGGTCPSGVLGPGHADPAYTFPFRSRVFPAGGEGFNDHAAPSPPPSQTAYLRQRGHFYPPPPLAFGTLRAHPAFPLYPLSIPPLITLGGWNAFITRPFSLQTFGIGV